MKNVKWVIGVGLLAASLGAQAASLTPRVSAGLGQYKGSDNAGGESEGDSTTIGLGATLSGGIFSADLGLDWYKINEPGGSFQSTSFTRTDLTLTGGVRVASSIGLLAGYRQADQGDSGLFADEIWTESGYFAGVRFGSFALSESVGLVFQFAYNFNDVEGTGGGKISGYDGLSGKVRMSFGGSGGGGKHALELRFQKFEGDVDNSVPTYTIEETYTYLIYTYSLPSIKFGAE